MDDITVTVTLTFAQMTKLVDCLYNDERIGEVLYAKLIGAYYDAEFRVEAAADKMEDGDG